MAKASGVTIEINPATVPILEGALELAGAGVITGADKTNREYVGDDISIDESVSKELNRVLYDPQTAGGMLISIAEEKADDLLTTLRRNYPRAERIGRVVAKGSHSIIIR
jgi:selenide,water dikinase